MDIFRIEKQETVGDEVVSTVIINREHDVFKGHFPGNPILPGVVSMQMVRECAGGADTFFSYVKEVKYLQPIIPDGGELLVTTKRTGNEVIGSIAKVDGTQMMKIRATLKE